MQTRRKRGPYGSKRPQILDPQNIGEFKDYLVPQRDTDYIREYAVSGSTRSLRNNLIALRQQLNNNHQLLNNILVLYKKESDLKSNWFSGLEQFQNAVNQLNQMDLENKELTKEQIKEAKQILESFNKAYKSAFQEIAKEDAVKGGGHTWSRGGLLEEERKLLYDIADSVLKISTQVFGDNIRTNDLKKVFGNYTPKDSQQYLQNYKKHKENLERWNKRVDFGDIYFTVNVHPSGKTTSGVDSEMKKVISNAQKRAQSDFERRQKKIQAKEHQKAIVQGLDEGQAIRQQTFQLIQELYGQNSSIDKVFDQILQHESLQSYTSDYLPQEDRLQEALAQFFYDQDKITFNSYFQPLVSAQMVSQMEKTVQERVAKNNFIAKTINQFASLADIGSGLVTSLSNAVLLIGSGTNQFNNLFDDLLGFPLKQISGIMELSQVGVQVAGQAVSTSVRAVTKFANGIITVRKRDKDDTMPQALQSVLQVTQAILKIGEAVVQILAQGFQIAQTVILQGVKIFTSVLSATFNLLKKILFTSKTIDQIMSILNLALTIFFLPATLIFGDQMLKAIFRFLDWMMQDDGGMALLNLLSNYYNLQIPIVEIIDDVLEYMNTIQKEISGALPIFANILSNVITPVIDYFKLFLSEESGDGQKIIEMCKEGFRLGEYLVAKDIIKYFLQFGEQALKFLYINRVEIMNIFNFSADILIKQLDFLSTVLNHMLAFCLAIGGGIGQFVGFISNMLFTLGGIGNIVSLMKLFGKYIGGIQILETALTKTGLLSIILGGATGAGIGYWFYNEYFSFQEGGYIPPTPGGYLVRVAEKETEYIIPESKVHLIRGHNNLVLEIKGDVYGTDGRKEIIEIINETSNRSRFR